MERLEKRRVSTSGTLLKVAILMIALQDNGQGAATPAMAAISAAFPQVGYQLVAMITTIPALMEALIPLVYPKIIDIVRKRSILFLCIGCYLVGGVGPAIFTESFAFLLFCRFLVGVGTGFFSVMCPDLMCDFFDGSVKNTMIGISGAVTGLSGVVFQTLGGWLAGIHWSYCFYAYLFSVICLLVPAFLLPEPDRKGKMERERQLYGENKVKVKLPAKVYVVAMIGFVLWMVLFTFLTNGAIILVGEGMATDAQVGMIFSSLTVGQVVGGATFGILLKKSNYSVVLAIDFVLCAIGLYTMSIAHTIPLFVTGCVIIGVGAGMGTPAYLSLCSDLVPYAAAAKANSIGIFFMGIGGTLSPFIFGNIGLDGRGQMMVGSIIYVIMVVVCLVICHYIKPMKAVDLSEGKA